MLLFNSRAIFCVWFAVDENTDYYSISMYLKTPVVRDTTILWKL